MEVRRLTARPPFPPDQTEFVASDHGLANFDRGDAVPGAVHGVAGRSTVRIDHNDITAISVVESHISNDPISDRNHRDPVVSCANVNAGMGANATILLPSTRAKGIVWLFHCYSGHRCNIPSHVRLPRP